MSQREYWRFYWPLSLTGVVMLLAAQFQNAILARYPQAAVELANFAIAGSLNFLFSSALVFLPQQVNVMGRTPAGRRHCLHFTLAVAGCLSLPMAVMAYTPWGIEALGRAFGLSESSLTVVVRYLRYFAPLMVVGSLRLYYTGLIVQAGLTGRLTLINTSYLAAVVLLLTTGFHLGWRSVETLAAAQAGGALVELSLCLLIYRRHRRHTAPEADPSPGPRRWSESWEFFWPVAFTSLMFALSRPIIFSFVSRLPHPEPVLAALRVGFDFGMFFFNPLNQFRHFYVNYGERDPAGVRLFMIRIMLGVTLLMAVVAATPLSDFFLGELVGVQGTVRQMAREVVAVLCLVPAAMTLRNYYHGQCLASRQTRRMGLGGIFRIAAIYLLSHGLHTLGWLNHATAAFILAAGFGAEALAVMTASGTAPRPDSATAGGPSRERTPRD